MRIEDLQTALTQAIYRSNSKKRLTDLSNLDESQKGLFLEGYVHGCQHEAEFVLDQLEYLKLALMPFEIREIGTADDFQHDYMLIAPNRWWVKCLARLAGLRPGMPGVSYYIYPFDFSKTRIWGDVDVMRHFVWVLSAWVR